MYFRTVGARVKTLWQRVLPEQSLLVYIGEGGGGEAETGIFLNFLRGMEWNCPITKSEV